MRMKKIEAGGKVIGSINEMKSYGRDGYYVQANLIQLQWGTKETDTFIFERGKLRGSCIGFNRATEVIDLYRELLMLSSVDLDVFIDAISKASF